jgi:anti-sigma factor RsiW
MNCRSAELEIQRALDAPLTLRERERLDGHLAVCPACRQAWEEYRGLSRDAAEWASRPALTGTPPTEFTAQVLARLKTRLPAPVSFWPRLGLAFAFFALLVAVSPFVSIWLPPTPHWNLDWRTPSELWLAAQSVLAVRWAEMLLLPALCVNALFLYRVRRKA